MINTVKVAWDSNVLIDAMIKDQKWWPELRPAYKDALEGKIWILVSEICVAEVCKLTDPSKGPTERKTAVKKIGLFFQNHFIERRAADRRESELAAQLIDELNLETCDALIAATASIHGASVLYTRDGLKPKKNKTSLLQCDGKIGEPPLLIKCPCASKYLGSGLIKSDDALL